MHKVNIGIDGEREAWPELFDPNGVHRGKVIHLPAVDDKSLAMAVVRNYTKSGAPGVSIRANLPDGFVVVVDTTLSMFLQIADIFKAKFGDPRADKHDGVIDPDVYLHRKSGEMWVMVGTSHDAGGGDALIILMRYDGMGAIRPGMMPLTHIRESRLKERYMLLKKDEIKARLKIINAAHIKSGNT